MGAGAEEVMSAGAGEVMGAGAGEVKGAAASAAAEELVVAGGWQSRSSSAGARPTI